MANHRPNSFGPSGRGKRQRDGALHTLGREPEDLGGVKRLGSAAALCRFSEGEISQLSGCQIERQEIQEDLRFPSKTICPVP